jgi:cathepsin L
VTHGKTYETEEDKKRLEIFLKTKEKIATHNSRFAQGQETYEMGLNQFADMEHSEFSRNYCGVRQPEK